MIKLEKGKIYTALKGTRNGVSKKGNEYGMIVIADGFWNDGNPKNPIYIWVDNISESDAKINENDDFEVVEISSGGNVFEFYKDKDGNRIERGGKKGENKLTFSCSVKKIIPLGFTQDEDGGELPFEMPGDTMYGELPL